MPLYPENIQMKKIYIPQDTKIVNIPGYLNRARLHGLYLAEPNGDHDYRCLHCDDDLKAAIEVRGPEAGNPPLALLEKLLKDMCRNGQTYGILGSGKTPRDLMQMIDPMTIDDDPREPDFMGVVTQLDDGAHKMDEIKFNGVKGDNCPCPVCNLRRHFDGPDVGIDEKKGYTGEVVDGKPVVDFDKLGEFVGEVRDEPAMIKKLQELMDKMKAKGLRMEDIDVLRVDKTGLHPANDDVKRRILDALGIEPKFRLEDPADQAKLVELQASLAKLMEDNEDSDAKLRALPTVVTIEADLLELIAKRLRAIAVEYVVELSKCKPGEATREMAKLGLEAAAISMAMSSEALTGRKAK